MKNIAFDIQEVMDHLPVPLSDEELKMTYGPAMKQDYRLLHQLFSKKAETSDAPDFIISLFQKAGTLLGKITNASQGLVFLPEEKLCSAFATRGVENTISPKTSFSLEKKSEKQILKLSATMEKTGLALRIQLYSLCGDPISPFMLELLDLQTGNVLLSKKAFSSAAVFHGVEPGVYQLSATAEMSVINVSFSVKE